MFKNVASQKIQLFAFDSTTNLPKTGDAANITAYISKDHGAVTVLGDTSATEMDATNAKGVYVFDLTQAETNADELTFSAKSTTANISIVPRLISSNPANFTALSISASGLVDLLQTAADKVWGTTTRALTSLTGFRLSAAGIQDVWDALTANLTTAGSIGKKLADWVIGTSQTGDSFAIVNDAAFGNAKLVRSTTPANTLDVSATGEAGLDFNNIKDASAGHTLTNITVPVTTTAVNLTTNNDKTGTGLSAAAVQAIHDAQTSNLTTVGSIGKWILDKLDVVLSSRLAASGYTAPLDAAGTRTAVGLVSANLDTQLAATAQDSTVAKDATVAKAVAVAALNNISQAQVLTQVNAALDAANTEVTAVPASTASLRDMLKYVFAWRRNKKLQTATTMTLRNNADGADIAASTVGDDGTTLTIGKDA